MSILQFRGPPEERPFWNEVFKQLSQHQDDNQCSQMPKEVDDPPVEQALTMKHLVSQLADRSSEVQKLQDHLDKVVQERNSLADQFSNVQGDCLKAMTRSVEVVNCIHPCVNGSTRSSTPA